jgi:hypothetical protein
VSRIVLAATLVAGAPAAGRAQTSSMCQFAIQAYVAQ